VKRSGRHALKARMPRLFPDHRSSPARRLRRVYDDVAARFELRDGLARQVALMTAVAFADHLDLVAQVATLQTSSRGSGKERAAILNRLRRRQGKAAGQYLAGLKTLATLASSSGHSPSLEDYLAARYSAADGHDRATAREAPR
jgi:hypothetical protein